MPVYYLESSGLFKHYRIEKGTDILNTLFSEKSETEVFVTSHLVTVEIEAAVARGFKTKVLNRQAYGVLLRSFAEDLEAMIVLPVSTALISEAAQQARQHELRALDAIHFATALRASQAAPGPLVFVASDKDLLSAARSSGFIVLDPEEPGTLQQLRNLRQAGL